MDLYLSNCLKAAEAAASKAASSSLKTDKETCSTKRQKPVIPKIGPSSLLDLPLGAKLPIIPGSTNIFYTTNISERLYQPSFGFNLNDPYCKLMETTYKSLHDPHLKAYFKRKDILKKLKQGGYITSNNKVLQYLGQLLKIIENQMNKLNEERRACDDAAAAEFQQWLLQEGKKPCPYEDRLIKLRHLRMINKELDKIENTSGRRNTLQLKEEDRQHWDNVRRKLSLRKQVEEEWQAKEMTLLTKIGEEVKRDAKVEEHRRKIREEINRKKQAMLQKRIAYHLQKLQKKDSKEKQETNISESRKQSETGERYRREIIKAIVDNMRTSISDQRLLQDSRESKSTSQTTKASFEEEKSSFYELLEKKFSPTETRRSSLPDEKTFQEFLEPKDYHHSSAKKTSFAEQTLFHETPEQKYGPTTTKRASFLNQKFIEDLLEAKFLYPNTTRRSYTDQMLMEDNLEPKFPLLTQLSFPLLTPSHTKKTSVSDQKLLYEPLKLKSTPNVKKTSFAEDKSFQQLMEAITPPQYIKKTSFADQKSSQESLESKRSSQHSQNNIKVFIKTSTISPQHRDSRNTREQKVGSCVTYVLFSIPVPSHPTHATEGSRPSLHNVPKQEANTPSQNTHKQSK
ncbi:Fsip2l [Phodopus roborovskii]|uniref:Fsip2l protein n=1 Tax=Phodopus roborovskii TaxID=109678 RepID=A0AAU9Z063_PHORO|nr:Fsip2l [Phodopus roborovskii]